MFRGALITLSIDIFETRFFEILNFEITLLHMKSQKRKYTILTSLNITFLSSVTLATQRHLPIRTYDIATLVFHSGESGFTDTTD